VRNSKILGVTLLLNELLTSSFQFPLPKAAPDGSRIMIYRPGAYDANIHTIDDSMRVATIIIDTLMFSPISGDDTITVAGQTAFIDLANVTMAHFVQMTPSTVKRLTVLTQDASPLRQKATHYLNAPAGSDVIFNMIKGFLTEKNRQRFFVHKSLESLQQAIPTDCLPAEYGGTVGTIKELLADLSAMLIANRDYFLQDDKFGVDEKKRPGRAKNPETLFGVDGSFRSLNVD
jgi:CRAL/TRIO domain